MAGETIADTTPMDVRRFFQPDLLRGRVALVTGGGTGIGLVAARALGQVGARVVVASRNLDRLRRAATVLCAEGIDCQAREVNIRDADMVERVVGEVAAEAGSLDVLVNNAGGQFVAPAERITQNGWRSVIDLNLNGTFYCSSAAARRMMERGTGGKILNIVASFADRSSAGMAHSGAARAGVVHLTRTLAREWAPFAISVNALGPQLLTEAARDAYGEEGIAYVAAATPQQRWAREEEVGSWIVALCSPFADYVTGAVLPLDGGNAAGEGLGFRGGMFPG